MLSLGNGLEPKSSTGKAHRMQRFTKARNSSGLPKRLVGIKAEH